MMDRCYGYTGRLLRVDLTARSFAVEDLPPEVMAGYIGGRGFVARYVYDEIPPGTDPLGPENRIYFATGPLTGTRMPSSGRYVVGTLSPLTGAYIRSVSGGAFGAQLKSAGYDLLVIEGAADSWCYLAITPEGVAFRDARPMAGMLTEEAESAVRRDLGDPRARCVTIGPAGEKRVRFACIQTERRSAGRGGVGCVMGAKRLKAIAVAGGRPPRLYRPAEFDALMRAHVRRNHGGAYYAHFHPLGTTGGVGLTYSLGVHPVRNFRRGLFAGIGSLMPEAIRALGFKRRNTGCWNCYMKCGSLFDVPDGRFRGSGYENPEYETMWSFGANCMNTDFAAILAANRLCDDFGADTISTGAAVAFLMECVERGYLTAADLNGVALRWGDAAAMVAVARQIVNRESPAGNLIADGGVRHAAAAIGRDAADFAMHAKGLELAAYDPRGLQGHGLGYAVSPIGGSHQIGYGVQELFGFPEQVDRFSPVDKGRHTIWANRYIMIFDCAVACGFANAFTESRLDFETFRQWLVLATGMAEAFGDPAKLEAAYDRIYTLEHVFNRRRGFTAEDDTLPPRLRDEPLPDGPSAGHVWHRDALVGDYYRARGWDEKSGVPHRATLERLALASVADDLEREGLLPRG
jgi:aldehyde:ferredoxin oxidoreductase